MAVDQRAYAQRMLQQGVTVVVDMHEHAPNHQWGPRAERKRLREDAASPIDGRRVALKLAEADGQFGEQAARMVDGGYRVPTQRHVHFEDEHAARLKAS